MNASETQDALTSAKAQLAQLNAAVTDILDPTVRSYSLDSGQTIQTTRRQDLPEIYASIEALENRICTLRARLSGGGVTLGVPTW